MHTLFIFTRGPQAGSKVLIENSKNLKHAMEEAREYMLETSGGKTNHRSNLENGTSEVFDVFDYNDFEVVHIVRTVDAAEDSEPTESPFMAVKSNAI